MAIFKTGTDRMPAPTRIDPTPAPEGSTSAVSLIAEGMRINGDIETAGVVKIEGTVQGAVKGARQVLLGRSGTIHGDVIAHEAILAGTISGTVSASDRVEIQESCRITGDIHTKTVVVHEGAQINGSVKMGDSIAVPSIAPERRPLAVANAG